MGVELYNRRWELVVAPSGGGRGLKVTDLRVTFRVEKTSSSEPNKATIQVYNLSQHSRDLIDKQDVAVTLKAGYEDLLQTVFVGVVKRVEHRKTPPDVVSELECKDGGIDLETAEFRRSYKAGTSRRRVVQDIIAAMPNTDTGRLSAAGIQGNIPGKLALSGGCRHMLNRLARSWDFEWSVQDGAVQVLDETGTTLPEALAIVLSPSTGLLGSPSKVARSKKGKSTNLSGAGAKFKSLLLPTIKPGVYVDLRSDLIKGYFKVESVTHDGDSHSSSWTTETEGVLIK